MLTIGSKIKNLRIALKLTQEELADAVGTKKQTIHKYETGIISNIPASKIKAIADTLNTTPAYLMGWVNDEKEKRMTPIAGITLKILDDSELLDMVQTISELSAEQRKAVQTLLSAFNSNK